MQGRIENEKKMNAKIIEKLQNEPKYMMVYMKSFVRKSYTTKNAYINDVLEFIHYLDEECGYNINDIHVFSHIKPSIINGYLDYLDGLKITTKNGTMRVNSSSIQNRKFYAIKDFFKFLLGDDYISKNPCDNVEPPKVDEVINVVDMNKQEIDLFLNNVMQGAGNHRAKVKQEKWRSRDYAIMTLALTLGLRVTSISEINVEDIDFTNNLITVTEKGNKTRSIMFGNNLRRALLNWIDEREKLLENTQNNALFISNQKKRICAKSIERLVAKYSEGINKHITPHKLRSTCATNVYSATGDIYLTASIIGHKNIQNTRRYARVVDEKREMATRTLEKIIFE